MTLILVILTDVLPLAKLKKDGFVLSQFALLFAGMAKSKALKNATTETRYKMTAALTAKLKQIGSA